MDPARVSDVLTVRTRAIMPVHLYGQAAPVETLRKVVGPDIAVIEDAAQSQGATRFGRPAGGLGTAAGTSFYPGKNLGAYGDAGAVLTNDVHLAQRARMIAHHGSTVPYVHEVLGFNSRLDTLQAVVLNAKLGRLRIWNELRRTAAVRYAALLAGIDEVRTPSTLPGNEHVWHLYVVRVPDRDLVLQRLRAQGVGAAVHYPVPVHLQAAFGRLGQPRGSFPVAERAAATILSLPLYPGITPEQQEHVVTALVGAVRA